jgi:hypothetical protein
MRTSADADCTWEDREDDLTPAIDAAHPMRTGDHATYERAVDLVGNRHSKQSLVALVNYLLVNQRPS